MRGHKIRKRLSDDAWNAIMVVVVIAAAVAGIVYWLQGMPS